MKRRALLKHLAQYRCELLREGGKHSVYWNPTNRRTSTVPRHTEISDALAEKICRDLEIPSARQDSSRQKQRED
ncbi:MAG: type II toxin-antitoxin system HicA family toxin [Anaerolineae bacterium]|nr:type II toxin-antitoxin system HicA family toxin [Anaerolineae bacterium]